MPFAPVAQTSQLDKGNARIAVVALAQFPYQSGVLFDKNRIVVIGTKAVTDFSCVIPSTGSVCQLIQPVGCVQFSLAALECRALCG